MDVSTKNVFENTPTGGSDSTCSLCLRVDKTVTSLIRWVVDPFPDQAQYPKQPETDTMVALLEVKAAWVQN